MRASLSFRGRLFILLQLGLAVDARTGGRPGQQPFFRYGVAAIFADAVGAILYPGQGAINVFQGLFQDFFGHDGRGIVGYFLSVLVRLIPVFGELGRQIVGFVAVATGKVVQISPDLFFPGQKVIFNFFDQFLIETFVHMVAGGGGKKNYFAP